MTFSDINYFYSPNIKDQVTICQDKRSMLTNGKLVPNHVNSLYHLCKINLWVTEKQFDRIPRINNFSQIQSNRLYMNAWLVQGYAGTCNVCAQYDQELLRTQGLIIPNNANSVQKLVKRLWAFENSLLTFEHN